VPASVSSTKAAPSDGLKPSLLSFVADAALLVQRAQHVQVDQAVDAADQHERVGALLQQVLRAAQRQQRRGAPARRRGAGVQRDRAAGLLRQPLQEPGRVQRLRRVVLGQAQQQRHRRGLGPQRRERFFERGMGQPQHPCLAALQRQRRQRRRQRRQPGVGHGADDEGLEAAVEPVDLAQPRHARAGCGGRLDQAQPHRGDGAGGGDDDGRRGHGGPRRAGRACRPTNGRALTSPPHSCAASPAAAPAAAAGGRRGRTRRSAR
jgi:hypothetical protein